MQVPKSETTTPNDYDLRLRDRALSATNDGVIITDPSLPDNPIIYTNSAFERITGYSAEEVRGNNCRFLQGPESDPAAIATLRNAVSSGNSCQVVILNYRKDGTSFWNEVHIAPVRDDEQRLTHFVGTQNDITARVHAEEALQRRHRELTVLHAITTAVVRHLSLPDVMRTLREEFAQQLDIHQGAVLLRRDPDSPLRIYENWGLADEVLAWIAARDLSALWPDGGHTGAPLCIGEHFDGAPSIPRSCLPGVVIPLPSGEDIHGVIFLCPATMMPLDDAGIAFLAALGQQVGLVIGNTRLYNELRQGRERVKTYAKRLADIQEAERARIARELHDEIGQSLTGLKFILKSLAQDSDDRLSSRLSDAENLVNEVTQRVRRISLDLRPAMLDDLGLIPALHSFFDRYTAQTGIPVRFMRSSSMLPERPSIDIAIYRIVQEALTNVARHSSANEVTVRISDDPGKICVQVEDHGCGFDLGLSLGKPTVGLTGMQQRVELLQGTLTIETAPGSGTTVTAVLPLEREGEWFL